ncbi:hypothetical protein YC2023_081773 [Brassica napus]
MMLGSWEVKVQTLHMYMDVSVWLSVRSYGVDPKVIVATSINPKIIGDIKQSLQHSVTELHFISRSVIPKRNFWHPFLL